MEKSANRQSKLTVMTGWANSMAIVNTFAGRKRKLMMGRAAWQQALRAGGRGMYSTEHKKQVLVLFSDASPSYSASVT